MKYPIGIQNFEKIREGGYLYIDKTDLIYDLVNNAYLYAGGLFQRKEGDIRGAEDCGPGKGMGCVSGTASGPEYEAI